MTDQDGQGRKGLSFGLLAFAAFTIVCAVGFGALGVWQIERLAWKNGLVEAVETRSRAEPAVLGLAEFSAIDPAASEYLRVEARGDYVGPDTLTQAVTALGGGFWVMTPLRLADGGVVLVNRGFVSASQRDAGILGVEGEVTVRGLLRQSEPDGGFLRANDPDGGRWYSRDVAEIGEALGLGSIAPFFIDADAGEDGYPVGGLTVLAFPNNHLVYALTWFGLTGLSLFALFWVLRDRFRR